MLSSRSTAIDSWSMIAGKSVLGLITARGGSKRLPGKHLMPLGGRALIAWTIEAGLGAESLDSLVLSSDSEEIIDVARAHGCETPWTRPSELAADETESIAVVEHALDNLPRFDFVVLLQPTSPFRTSVDIDAAIALCVAGGGRSCVSVCRSDKPGNCLLTVDAEGSVQQCFSASQDATAPELFTLNGAVYVAATDWLRETRTFVENGTLAYEMPRERSVDIDTALDFRIAAMLLEEGAGECGG